MFSLGLDTGGTYTDAVIFDDAAGRVLAKAKSPTTRHDLVIGIRGAANAALSIAEIDPADIGLVSISTTLATNALVEGHGGRACLVLIGFDESHGTFLKIVERSRASGGRRTHEAGIAV